MLELIKSKKNRQLFWDFIKRLKHIRLIFNQLLLLKFRNLPKLLKKNLEVQTLFNEVALNMDSCGMRTEAKKAEEFKKVADGEDEKIRSKTEAHESYHARVSQQIDEFM